MSVSPQKLALVIASRARAVQMLSYLYDDAVNAGFEVTVICPDEVYNEFHDFFETRGAARLPYVHVSQKSLLMAVNHLRYHTLADFTHRENSAILEEYRRMDFAASSILLPYIVWPLSRILRLFPPLRDSRWWDRLEYALFGGHKTYHSIFSHERFDWVAFPAPVLRSPSELLLFFAAKRVGLRLAALDEAFGQFFNFSVSFRPFDRIFVWGELTVDYGNRFQGIPKERMTIGGPYRFDPYFNNRTPSREDYFRAHELDPTKRLITCAISGVDMEFRMLDELVRGMKEGRFSSPTQVFVSISPFVSKMSDFSPRYDGIPDLISNDPNAPVSYRDLDTARSHMYDLGGLLKWSDVIISQASTLAVEAAIFNTPVLYHLFDLDYREHRPDGTYSKMRELEALRRIWYDKWPTIAEVIATGAVPCARSIEELMTLIARSLAGDGLAEERKTLVKKICTYTDGRSGARIMKELLASG